MTYRKEIIKRITKAAKSKGLSFELKREGGKHSIYDLDGLVLPLPRHNDIPENTTRDIYKECEPKLGKGWWRK